MYESDAGFTRDGWADVNTQFWEARPSVERDSVEPPRENCHLINDAFGVSK